MRSVEKIRAWRQRGHADINTKGLWHRKIAMSEEARMGMGKVGGKGEKGDS